MPFTGKESQKPSKEGFCVVCHLSEAAAAHEEKDAPMLFLLQRMSSLFSPAVETMDACQFNR